VALDRILFGRPQLKYHEAGMDLGLAEDPIESFRIFQGLIMAEYEKMIDEYGFDVVDATQPAEHQQALVRDLVSSRIHLPSYRWRHAR
jgi:dTMP kinase